MVAAPSVLSSKVPTALAMASSQKMVQTVRAGYWHQILVLGSSLKEITYAPLEKWNIPAEGKCQKVKMGPFLPFMPELPQNIDTLK